MRRHHDVIGDRLAHLSHELAELVGHGVAHRVGDVDRRGAGLHGHPEALEQESELGAGGVLGRELDVVRVANRLLHAVADGVEHLGLRHPEHVLHVDVARRDEGVDPPPFGALQGLGGPVDVAGDHPGQGCYDRTADARGDLPDGLELALRRDGKARLDDVDLEAGQLLRDLDLLGPGERDPGGLLAVAERGIEDAYYIVRHRVPPSSPTPATASSGEARDRRPRYGTFGPGSGAGGSSGTRCRPR